MQQPRNRSDITILIRRGVNMIEKLHIAALRRFFERLVNRHVAIINPAATVKSELYSIIERKTPEISARLAQALLASINPSDPVGRRDRVILATLAYTAARVGAIVRLRVNDLVHDGDQYARCGSPRRAARVARSRCGTISSGSCSITSSPPGSPRVPSSVRRTRRPGHSRRMP